MYNILALVIILICLAVILVIINKKLPLLASFDVGSIPAEKASETKTKIMEERLNRKIKVFYNKIAPFFKIIKNFSQRKFQDIQGKMKKWEEKYKTSAKKEVLVTKEEFEDLEKKNNFLLKEAEDFISRENYSEAEKKYLEILSLDPKNTKAFYGLGNLYFLQKEYDEARQTYEHILKLNNSDSLAFFELAEVFYTIKNYEEATFYMEKALEFEPNNPKYLDLLLTISIIIKNKDLAQETLDRLRGINPENAKIAEFVAQINEL